MEPSEIVRACLERGVMVSPDDLKCMEGGLGLEEFIASKSVPKPDAEQPSGRVVFRLKKQPDAATPKDITGNYSERFDKLKSILLSKASAISIGNARDGAGMVSLRGIAKQSGQAGFALEDTTGEIDVEFAAGGNEDGDIVCCRGTIRADRLVCKEVLFPDVPLTRQIGRMDAKLMLAPKQCDCARADIVLSPSQFECSAKFLAFDSSPSQLNMHKDGCKVAVLFFSSAAPLKKQDVVSMLRKRSLRVGNPFGFIAIDPLPDVFWVFCSQPSEEWIETYKGVTMVHSSSSPAMIDLNSREASLIQ